MKINTKILKGLAQSRPGIVKNPYKNLDELMEAAAKQFDVSKDFIDSFLIYPLLNARKAGGYKFDEIWNMLVDIYTDEESGYKLIVLDDAQIDTIFKDTNKVRDLYEFLDNTVGTTPADLFKDSLYNEFGLMRRGILAKTMVYLAGLIVANVNM